MAHIPGERVMKEMAKSASKAGGSEKMGKGMMRGMMDGMMAEGMMGPMMGGMMGEGMMGPMMGGMMKEGMMGPMMEGMMGSGPHAGMVMKGAATGAAVSVATRPGKSLLRRAFSNPWVVLGLGIAAGYLIHKYRQDIIASASGLTGGGRAAENRQTLADVAAES